MTSSQLFVLDVAHGNASILVTDQDVGIVDTGRRGRLVTFLLDNDIKAIKAVVISHADADHVGGLVELLLSSEITVDCVYINPDPTQESKDFEAIRIAANECRDTEIVTSANSSNVIRLGSENAVTLEILAPDKTTSLTGVGGTHPDGTSVTRHRMNVVVRVSQDDRQYALLAGDLDSQALEIIEENCRAEMLVFPHHGGRPGKADPVEFTKKICQSVNPKFIVFSVASGEKNHPRPEIVSCIASNFPEVTLLATGRVESIEELLEQNNCPCQHRTGDGSYFFDLNDGPLVPAAAD